MVANRGKLIWQLANSFSFAAEFPPFFRCMMPRTALRSKDGTPPETVRKGGQDSSRHERRRKTTSRCPGAESQLATLGPVPFRTAMGHGARGLFGGRQSLGLLHARACAHPDLSPGRGRLVGH